MNNYELISFPSPDALAGAVAACWLTALVEAASHRRPYHVALSGGRIARLFFAALSSAASSRRKLLDPVHFFWADERCVPPTDRESNFAAANEDLLAPLGIASERIHRIRGELPPDQAVAGAIADVEQLLPSGAAGAPVFDMVFLGMGEEGHVASLFPGAASEAAPDSDIYLAVVAAKPPPQRITLSYSMIALASEVWVLASGPGKQCALAESLGIDGKSPMARVLRSRLWTKIFTDIPLAAC